MNWNINKKEDEEVYKLADEYSKIREDIVRLQTKLNSVRKDLYSKMKTEDISSIESNIGIISIFNRVSKFKRELNKDFKELDFEEQDNIAKKGFLHRTYVLDGRQIANANDDDFSHLKPYIIPYKTLDWIQFKFHKDKYDSIVEEVDDL